jgi:hypothetical protein
VPKSVVGPDVKVVNDARAVIANPEIDIVIELIGGYGIAKATSDGGHRRWQACCDRQQGFAGRARYGDFCRSITPRA